MEQLRKRLLAMDKKEFLKKFLLFAVVLITIGVLAQCAFAITAPTAGSKFSAISDLVVNDIVKGPVGYAVTVVAGVFTGTMALMSKLWPAVGGLIGTAIMISSPSIVESMGAMII